MRCCTTGIASALAGKPRKGCHREQAVRHLSARHRPARPGNSRKAVTIHGTPPKPGKAACPARRYPVCGDRVEGTPSGASTRSAALHQFRSHSGSLETERLRAAGHGKQFQLSAYFIADVAGMLHPYPWLPACLPLALTSAGPAFCQERSRLWTASVQFSFRHPCDHEMNAEPSGIRPGSRPRRWACCAERSASL